MKISEVKIVLENPQFNRQIRNQIRELRNQFPRGSDERTRLNNYMNSIGRNTPSEITRLYARLAMERDYTPDTSLSSADEVWNQIRDARNELPRGSDERARLSNIMNQINRETTPPEIAAMWLIRAASGGNQTPDPDTDDLRGRDQRDVPAQQQSGDSTPDPDADDPRGRDQRDVPAQQQSGDSTPDSGASVTRRRPTIPGQERSGPRLDQVRRNLQRGSRGQAVRVVQQALGIPADGIFGPQTQRAVRQFQQNNGLQVDGIVGRQTLAALRNFAQSGNVGNVDVTPGRISAAPQTSRRPQQRPTQNSSKINNGPLLAESNNNMSSISRILELAGTNKKSLNESQSLEECPPMEAGTGSDSTGSPVTMNVNLSASGKEHVDDLLSMMKAAGLNSAEPVSSKTISQMPDLEPCPICGKMHDPETGGCSSDSSEMGDYIRMLSQEAEEDGGFEDATTEPDEEYSDISASIPSGDDLNRSKKPYSPTDGGDNPMALEQQIKNKLAAALAEKKAKPDYIDLDGDGDTKEPMKKAAKDAEDKEVSEDDDDPCWKNYKMVGTKKKNGKEVPNCVPK